MRTTSLAAAAALTLVCVSASLHSQPPERGVDPRSAQLLAQGRAARAAGNVEGATDLIETALAVDPNDTAALRGQGEALVAKGALKRAQENLAKIRSLCKADCGDATALAAVVAKGPPVTTAQVTSGAPTTE